MNLRTMLVNRRVGRSPRGTVAFPGQANIPIGKMTPYIRSSEDAKALVRTPFLEPGVPSEVNLAATPVLRPEMMRLRAQQTIVPGRLPVESLIKGRPSVGSLPSEIFLNPSDKALKAMANNSGAFKATANLLASHTPGSFWVAMAEQKLYPQLLDQMMGTATFLGADVIAPPVPPITPDLKASVGLGFELNNAAAAYLDRVAPNRNVGLLRSVHVDPSALRNATLLRDTLASVRLSVEGDLDFWGLHVAFTDPANLGKTPDHVRGAKELAEGLANIASDTGIWVWGSDLGPASPIFLDQGFAFTSYTPAMTPRKVYSEGGAGGEYLYGKALNIWDWDLLDRSAVAARNWTLQDTELMSPQVAPSLRTTTNPADYRVEFAKPHNIAVAERFNRKYEEDLDRDGLVNPGTAHVGKSHDPKIAHWA